MCNGTSAQGYQLVRGLRCCLTCSTRHRPPVVQHTVQQARLLACILQPTTNNDTQTPPGKPANHISSTIASAQDATSLWIQLRVVIRHFELLHDADKACSSPQVFTSSTRSSSEARCMIRVKAFILSPPGMSMIICMDAYLATANQGTLKMTA